MKLNIGGIILGETKEQIINLIKEQYYGKVIDLFEKINKITVQDVIQNVSENEIQAIFGEDTLNLKTRINNANRGICFR